MDDPYPPMLGLAIGYDPTGQAWESLGIEPPHTLRDAVGKTMAVLAFFADALAGFDPATRAWQTFEPDGSTTDFEFEVPSQRYSVTAVLDDATSVPVVGWSVVAFTSSGEAGASVTVRFADPPVAAFTVVGFG